jgi:hypothetical protein
LLLCLASAGTLAAQNAGLNARELYYQAVAQGTQPEGGKSSPSTGGRARTDTKRAKSTGLTGGGEGTSDAPVTAVALRLGLRYNLLRIDPETRASQSVDPDVNFAAGDCLALQLTPNRTGRLFIFNRGAAGTWQPLMPSPAMPDENTLVSAGNNIQIPRNYCFRIDDTHGTERLLVLVTEQKEDFDQLNREMQNLIPPTDGPKAAEPDTRTQIAAVLTDRDLRIEKIAEPEAKGEPPHSVYAVKNLASNQDRLLIEIRIRHE